MICSEFIDLIYAWVYLVLVVIMLKLIQKDKKVAY